MDIELIKKNLENMGIYQLREFGREVGVQSSTTYQKNALIEKILLILSGQEKPSERTNQGRPPKGISKFFATNNITEKNNCDGEIKYAPIENKNPFLTLNCPEAEKTSEEIRISGYLENEDDKYFIRLRNINTNKFTFVFILNNIVEKYSLVVGDKIKGIAHRFTDNKALILSNVLEINNIKEDNYKKTNLEFDELNINFEKRESFKILNNEIEIGSRNLIEVKNYTEDNALIKELIKTKDFKVIYLGLQISPEQEYLITRIIENSENFIVPFDCDKENNIIFTNNCINYVKNMIVKGEKILLIIQNINMLLNTSNQDIIKTLFALSRDTTNGGSITTLATVVTCDSLFEKTLNTLGMITSNILKI